MEHSYDALCGCNECEIEGHAQDNIADSDYPDVNRSRFCIAKDGKKWRVYDDELKKFAEPFTDASDKADAQRRAGAMNGGHISFGN